MQAQGREFESLHFHQRVMIEYIKGDIFDLDVEAIVNPVNCVGVMGAGLAKEFKIRYWDNYVLYKDTCNAGQAKMGRMMVYRYPDNSKALRYIVNFPTKAHWKDKSRLSDIELGLWDLRKLIKHSVISSIALPKLGCGLGGLQWLSVKLAIEKTLGYIEDTKVYVVTK